MCKWATIRVNMLSCQKTFRLHSNANKNSDYKVAVQMLNSLQSNAAVLEKIRKERDSYQQNNLSETEVFLKKTGIEVDDLNRLNVIHISGTKGKGSTAAFCESILRCHKFKTGFYSSPHLVAVRERIRINGQPLSQQAFTSYFWEVYDKLSAKKVYEGDMPAYFKFLTIMAYYIFLKEKVDVAIVEVGIGGEYDATNIIRKPLVCGVTSLGLDHTSILGDSIENIAWHKAGIFKAGVTAFTVPQPPNALPVLIKRAKSKQSQLHVVPSLENYDWGNNNIELGLASSIQKWNASLAIQLTNKWLQIRNNSLSIPKAYDQEDGFQSALPFPISECVAEGLRKCSLSGRCQIINRKPIIYFLDGAHTTESIENCVEWFRKASKESGRKERSVYKILIFNISGDRSPESLMLPLIDCKFDLVIFCPNFATVSIETSSDQAKLATTWKSQMERCMKYETIWLKENLDKSNLSNSNDHQSQIAPNSFTKVFPCISDVINWLSKSELPSTLLQPSDKDYYSMPQALSDVDQIQVLITGSILLVGGFLGILDPEL